MLSKSILAGKMSALNTSQRAKKLTPQRALAPPQKSAKNASVPASEAKPRCERQLTALSPADSASSYVMSTLVSGLNRNGVEVQLSQCRVNPLRPLLPSLERICELIS